jgi:hypothetical protein
MQKFNLDSSVWGPHYWFFLHTLAMTYPHRPNTMTKKKYYDFVQNIPMFIPIENMAGDFSKLLNNYPVSPYLDSRDAFIRWMHFIHNKINEKLEKPKITLEKFYADYYESYKPKDIKMREYYKVRSKLIYLLIIACIVFVIYYFYNK